MTQPHYIDREAVKARLASILTDLLDDAEPRPSDNDIARAIHGAMNALSAPMEAVAWREKMALTTTPSGGGRPVTILFSQVSSFNMTNCNDDERRVVMRGGETYRLRKSDADTIIQALAVIPTEGLGSSATPIPTCDAEGLAANLMADLGVLAATAREVPFDVWDRFANNVMRAAEKLTASTPPEAGQ